MMFTKQKAKPLLGDVQVPLLIAGGHDKTNKDASNDMMATVIMRLSRYQMEIYVLYAIEYIAAPMQRGD